jgi:hypothetical protein
MASVWCRTVQGAIDELLSDKEEKLLSVGVHYDLKKDCIASKGSSLISALRESKRFAKERTVLQFANQHSQVWADETGLDFLKSLMNEWKSNEAIALMGLSMSDYPKDDPEYDRILAKGFDDALHASGVQNIYATKSFILDVCQAALKKDDMKQLIITSEKLACDFDEETVQALTMVKMKFPECTVGGSKSLECLIASKAIINAEAEKAVQMHQRAMIQAYTKSNTNTVLEQFKTLKTAVALPEQNRVLKLLPLLSEKYAVIIGGLELLCALPSDFDDKDLRQYMPLEGTDYAVEDRVRFLLALSDYKQPILHNVCTQVANDLNNFCEAVDKNPAEGTQIVDQFFVQHGVAEFFCSLDAYEVEVTTGGTRNKAEQGKYLQCGFCNGAACFELKTNDHKSYLYYAEEGGTFFWKFSGTLGGDTSNTFLADENSGPNAGKRLTPIIQEGDKQEWQCYNDSQTPKLKHCAYDKPVKDEVIEFLTKRKQLNVKHLALKDCFVEVHMGPTKSFDRAVQKGVAWLRDLNRSTLLFDSPAVLVVAFKMLEMQVIARGGKLVRLTNLFFKDGKLNLEPRAPPCIHINFMIDDYIYEVMLMLCDFAAAKDRVHKFYELARTERPIDVARPVFDPLPLDDVKEDGWAEASATSAGSALNAARKLKSEEDTQTAPTEKEAAEGNTKQEEDLLNLLKQMSIPTEKVQTVLQTCLEVIEQSQVGKDNGTSGP